MKSSLAFLLMAALPVAAQSSPPSAESPVASITGAIFDGTPAEPSPLPEPIEFTVKSSYTEKRMVEESPELTGLPSIKGSITETVQLVEDPGLVDPEPPTQPLPVGSIVVQNELEEMRQRHQDTKVLFIVAAVYDHHRTLLRCYPNGKVLTETEVWSNLDFNHFTGFSSFQVTGADGAARNYALLMSVVNIDTEQARQRAVASGVNYVAPEIPNISGTEPNFVTVQGNDVEALKAISDLHVLHRVEGDRMEAAYCARQQAYEERRAYLLANPAKPKDVTVSFWKRDHPAPAAAQQLQEGNHP